MLSPWRGVLAHVRGAGNGATCRTREDADDVAAAIIPGLVGS